ncbi:unnamed protein product [Sphenostylis stenocarpa]|uniref:Uncharacterized protein n=1 Tax=Sphenostylis stenocarpa TaxID=92480 RepID=A0AA86TIK4_9FABA|nr:unnamed protein product [Sphenostylis stenocarpa]
MEELCEMRGMERLFIGIRAYGRLTKRDSGLATFARRDGGPEYETAVSTLKGENPYFHAKNPSYPSMGPNSLS